MRNGLIFPSQNYSATSLLANQVGTSNCNHLSANASSQGKNCTPISFQPHGGSRLSDVYSAAGMSNATNPFLARRHAAFVAHSSHGLTIDEHPMPASPHFDGFQFQQVRGAPNSRSMPQGVIPSRRNVSMNGYGPIASYNGSSGLTHHSNKLGLQVLVDFSPTYSNDEQEYDQFRDMRLDIDNMGYEELLSLGERIGNVSTGLSDDPISKCLSQISQGAQDQQPKEERCAICLEELSGVQGRVRLKKCEHDYHVSCIKKWLSMKNTCPICKKPATDAN